jgi:hypothetical protein
MKLVRLITLAAICALLAATLLFTSRLISANQPIATPFTGSLQPVPSRHSSTRFEFGDSKGSARS